MIKVFIPTDRKFNYDECKKLFDKYSLSINENQEFKDIVKNTFFYAFYCDDKLIGCIYYYIKDNKLFVNAFADRHTHLLNIECFKKTFDWFNCDIYAQTPYKTAILCLYRCGFKKIDDNLYKYERE